jgi:hypothetical protein
MLDKSLNSFLSYTVVTLETLENTGFVANTEIFTIFFDTLRNVKIYQVFISLLCCVLKAIIVFNFYRTFSRTFIVITDKFCHLKDTIFKHNRHKILPLK